MPVVRAFPLALFALALLPSVPERAVAEGRLFTVEDHLALQTLGSVEVSPREGFVAVTFSRLARAGDDYREHAPENRLPMRHDLAVISIADGQVIFREAGAATGSTAVAPRWSPDGRRLAYLVRDRDDQVSLRVWDSRTRRAHIVVPEGVRPFEPIILSPFSASEPVPFAWNGSDEILLVRSGRVTDEISAERRTATERGGRGQLSVRVWRSRDEGLCRPQDELVSAQLDGAMTLVRRGAISAVALARSGDAVVIAERTGLVTPPARTVVAKPPGWGASDQPISMTWSAAAYRRTPAGWSRLGPAVTGRGAMLRGTAPRWRAGEGSWAVIDVSDPFAEAPEVRLVEVDIESGQARDTLQPGRREAMAALAQQPASATSDAQQDLRSLAASVRAELGADARAVARTADGDLVVSSRIRGVTKVFAVRGNRASTLLTLNGHLAGVAAPMPLAVSYRANGEERRGWLFLPEGASGPAPVVVTAYPMSGPRSTRTMDLDYFFPELLLLRQRGVAIFIADFRLQQSGQPHFAYDDAVDRVRTELGAVVEALGRDPRLDARRLGFLGHSFGGYTAVSLLAHSTDFRAIVAYAALGDLGSYAFETPPYIDQTCGPEQIIDKHMNHEGIGTGEVSNRLFTMPGPAYAWKALYDRNSPLLHLENARTPTLVIQGSEDGFRDGERVFNTLYRLGLDAELLYYWGEGHVISGPENVRHRVERTVAWMLEKLGIFPGGESPAPS